MGGKIDNQINKHESETFERKPSLSDLDRVIEIICSFANKKGGTILIGVNNKVKGINIGKDTLEKISNKIINSIEPNIYPEIKINKINSKKIIQIKVQESSNKPHTAFGKPFIRIGDTTRLMKRGEYGGLLLERKPRYFDKEICRGIKLSNIDKEKVNKFREIYEEINKTTIKGSNKELLKSLKCTTEVDGNIKVTNAGVLLFCKKPEDFFSMNYITIARYPGKEKAQTYSDIKDFYGNLFDIIDSANEYIKEHVQEVSRVVKDKLAREVIPQYPYFAIRELITNAVVHRDYSIRGSRIIIRMFKDRIEFNSPGCLPANITPDNIVYEQYSRNPIIADVFNQVKFIEKLGEGWDKIIDSVKKHPLKPKMPEIIDTGNTVIITLFSAELENVEKGMLKEVDEVLVNEWLTKVNEKLTKELSDKEKEIILFVIKNKKISSADCQRLLNISRVMVNRYFSRLIEKKLLLKKGIGRSTYYVFKK